MQPTSQYSNVFQLVQKVPQAQCCYISLPDYVRGQVEQHAQEIHTCDALYRFVALHRHM